MNAHTLAREEIEEWREDIIQLMGSSDEDKIQINVLCDMALEALEARLRAFSQPEALPLDDVKMLAEVHMGDGDELGVAARKILDVFYAAKDK